MQQKDKNIKGRTPHSYIRAALLTAGLTLPALSLIPFGSIWLWQNGYLLHWAIAACCSTAAAWGFQKYLAGPLAVDAAMPGSDPSFGGTPLEDAAWRDVQELARVSNPRDLTSQDTSVALAIQVIERVARIMRPAVADPVWHFTAPEALHLVEQVSRRLRRFIDDSVPLGDRLTLAQAIQLYRWRGVIDAAETAYDAWRFLRLLNPVTAITHELRERLSKELLSWSKEHAARRLVEVYVEEVGRAAIDLYSGRLRSIDHSPSETPVVAEPAAPLRIFVCGQINAGKSRLVNALAAEANAATDIIPTTAAFTAYRIVRDDLAGAIVVDSPGLGTSDDTRQAIIDAASASDLVIWVSAAHRADREIDRRALAELRKHFAERPDRKPPPLLLVLSHVDQLRPWGEWSPPYDIAVPSTPKAQSIRDAVVAASGDLDIEISAIVPACLDTAVGLYNVDTVWGRIVTAIPEARQAQLIRMLRTSATATRWRKLWQQAAGAGRIIGGNIFSRRQS